MPTMSPRNGRASAERALPGLRGTVSGPTPAFETAGRAGYESPLPTTTAQQRRAAAITCADRATDRDDLTYLLGLLGLREDR